MQHLLAAIVVVAALLRSAHAEEPPGLHRFVVHAAHRPSPVAASIWYPARTRTDRVQVGENDLFHGVSAALDAAPIPGSRPLVLLSHGSGGNMDNLAWLSAALVARGAMVLAVNHPGATSGDSSPRQLFAVSHRARDLSAALDAMLAHGILGGFVDRTRISAVGFSLGGATALSLGGLSFDGARYRSYCLRFPREAPDCAFLEAGGVDLRSVPELFGQAGRDARVARIVAVDPAFTYAVAPGSLAGMLRGAGFLNLGGPERWRAADVGPDGSLLALVAPEARYEVVLRASHFTFLGLCKPGAVQRLVDAQDDPICTDPPGVDRRVSHREIAAAVARLLGLAD